MEVEFDNAVPFLDTNVNQAITLDWNTILTFSGLYINYYSNHPLRLIHWMDIKNRMLRLSDPSFHRKNSFLLQFLFSNNKYPPWLVNKVL